MRMIQLIRRRSIIFSIFFLLTASICCFGQSLLTVNKSRIKRLDGSRISAGEIERTVERLVEQAHIAGLGVAVINNSKIVYRKSFGFRNHEENQPLTEQTVMYGASLTKAVFAYFVMQLVADGALDLDKPVYQYLAKPLPEYDKYKDLAADERYKLITARMLLSHTAGFPNFRWINPSKKLDIKFAPGSLYSYSGEGFNLLQFVIEEITGKKVGEMIQQRIFKPFGMTRTSLTWDARFEDDYAVGYDEAGKPLGHERRANARAAGSMDTTLDDYAKFIAGVMRSRGLKRKYRDEMIKPQIQIFSKYQFPTPPRETTDENRGIELGYGLGWGTFRTPYGMAYFKEGHDDGWENHAVCFPEKKTAVIFMSNSSNGDDVFMELLNTLVKDRSTPWKWENYKPFVRAN